MHMKRTILITALGALCLMTVSCMERESLRTADPGVGVKVTLECEPLDDEPGGTKSSFASTDLTRVTDVNYYLFDTAGNLLVQEYFPDASKLSVALPDYDAEYRCYFFANVGRYTVPDGTRATDMATAVHFDYGTYANYMGMVASSSGKGFPMSGVVEPFNRYNAGRITLKRLVHTLRVRVDTEALNASTMTFTGIRVKQAARDIYPFAPGGSRATAVFAKEDSDADALTSADMDVLNDGGTATLYMLENMRGDLLTGNTAWKEKVPRNISETERRLASYIEISASVSTPTADYGNNIYRAYLGRSAENFDVVRSTAFTLTNSFTNDMIPAEEWRVETATPTITGQLKYKLAQNNSTRYADMRDYYGITDVKAYSNDPDKMVPSGSDPTRKWFYLTDGFQQVYYIYRSNKDIRYTVSLSKDKTERPYLDYTLEDYNDNYAKLTIKSCRKETFRDEVDRSGHRYLSNGDVTGVPYDSDTPKKTYPVTITVRSEDGVLSDEITCRYYYGKHEVAFSWGEDGRCRVRMGNPMGLDFTFDSFGRVGMYYNGIDSKVYMKKNIDRDFLDYIGAGWTSAVGKYGTGEQDNAYRFMPLVFDDSDDMLAVIVYAAFLGAPFTLGASTIPLLGVLLSSATGELRKFHPSVIYVPFETACYSASPGGSSPTVIDLNGSAGAPSRNWGNYQQTIVNWAHNKSLGDVLSSYDGRGDQGAIFATNSMQTTTYHRYPCPFSLEAHVDMIAGRVCMVTDGSQKAFVATPLSVLSATPGLCLSDFTYREINNMIRGVGGLTLKIKEFVKDLVMDRTIQTNRRGSMVVRSAFVDSDYSSYQAAGNENRFVIYPKSFVEYSDFPKIIAGDTKANFENILGTDYLNVNSSGDWDYSVDMGEEQCRKLVQYFLMMPSDFTFNTSTDWARPKIRSLNEQVWSWLAKADNHFMTFTLNDYYDYLTE